MTPREMKLVHDRHVEAESRKDVEAAVATYHEDCFYENLPLGLRFEGKGGVALQYAASFAMFPDGDWGIEGEAFGPDVMVAWGTFRSSDVQSFMGLEPRKRRLEMPLLSIVPFRDGMMAGERLFYDLASVCDQLGVSVEEARAAAGQLRLAMAGREG